MMADDVILLCARAAREIASLTAEREFFREQNAKLSILYAERTVERDRLRVALEQAESRLEDLKAELAERTGRVK